MLYETVQAVGFNKNPTKHPSLAVVEFHFLHNTALTKPQLHESTSIEIKAC